MGIYLILTWMFVLSISSQKWHKKLMHKRRLGTSLLLTIDNENTIHFSLLKKKKKDNVGRIRALHPCNNLTTREKTG